MPPSNRKRDLKTRITDYSSKYYALEQKFKKVQLNFKSGKSEEFDGKFSDSDEEDSDELINLKTGDELKLD